MYNLQLNLTMNVVPILNFIPIAKFISIFFSKIIQKLVEQMGFLIILEF